MLNNRLLLFKRGEDIGTILSYLGLGYSIIYNGKTLKMDDMGHLYYQCYDGKGNEVDDGKMYVDILNHRDFVDMLEYISEDELNRCKEKIAMSLALVEYNESKGK